MVTRQAWTDPSSGRLWVNIDSFPIVVHKPYKHIGYHDLLKPSLDTLQELWSAWSYDLDPIPVELHHEGSVNIAIKHELYAKRADFHFPTETKWDVTKSIEQAFAARAQTWRYTIWATFMTWPDLVGEFPAAPAALVEEEDYGIKAAVAKAETLKEEGNRGGDYSGAFAKYLLGLRALIPFNADALLMSFEQAHECGIRQIEHALVCNLARAVLARNFGGTMGQKFASTATQLLAFGERDHHLSTGMYRAKAARLYNLVQALACLEAVPPELMAMANPVPEGLDLSPTGLSWLHESCCKNTLEALRHHSA